MATRAPRDPSGSCVWLSCLATPQKGSRDARVAIGTPRAYAERLRGKSAPEERCGNANKAMCVPRTRFGHCFCHVRRFLARLLWQRSALGVRQSLDTTSIARVWTHGRLSFVLMLRWTTLHHERALRKR